MVSDVPETFTLTTESLSIPAEIADYRRSEDSTYLTLPEWYTVFSYQEYAEFISENPPSKFPYFRAIGQFWYTYCNGYEAVKEEYPTNFGNHIMLSVIGTSFTIEYAIKGIYENTIGWLTEWSSYETEEDYYAIEIAKDYGTFITTDPWYAFPFGKKFIGLWKETNFWGPHIIRKGERKLILSIENGVKTVYSAIIRAGTRLSYGVADDEIYVQIENIPHDLFDNDPNIRLVKDLDNQSAIITLPHYQGFTDLAPRLVKKGVRFKDIAGNDEIMITVIAPKDWKYNLKNGQVLFTMEVIINADLKRMAIQVPVVYFHEIISALEDEKINLEHIFDY